MMKTFFIVSKEENETMDGNYTKHLHLEKLSDNIWRWFTINAFRL